MNSEAGARRVHAQRRNRPACDRKGSTVVAIDWTTTPGDVIVRADLQHEAADGSASTETVLDALENGHKVGVDCMFGWPSSYIAAVTAHGVCAPWPAGPEPEERRELRLRATNRHPAERHGVNALSVSADRESGTEYAMSACYLLLVGRV